MRTLLILCLLAVPVTARSADWKVYRFELFNPKGRAGQAGALAEATVLAAKASGAVSVNAQNTEQSDAADAALITWLAFSFEGDKEKTSGHSWEIESKITGEAWGKASSMIDSGAWSEILVTVEMSGDHENMVVTALGVHANCPNTFGIRAPYDTTPDNMPTDRREGEYKVHHTYSNRSAGAGMLCRVQVFSLATVELWADSGMGPASVKTKASMDAGLVMTGSCIAADGKRVVDVYDFDLQPPPGPAGTPTEDPEEEEEEDDEEEGTEPRDVK